MIKKLIAAIIIIIVGFWLFWIFSVSPVNSSDKHSEIFVIGKGQGVKAIAKNLAAQKLIKNEFVFYLLVKKMGIENQIQAGSFRLSPSQSAEQIATSLTKGSLDVWVTIPEGKRAEEIADIFQKSLPSYEASWREKLDANEGYLFPDTYLFPQHATIDQIITIMTNNFAQKYAEVEKVKKTSMTKEQIVILASILEREAITPSDMAMVASVFENRLSIGMPLGSDVTVAYALGYNQEEKTWWKKDLTVDDLEIKSPYNTRASAGLPPTAISNPGLVSLKAVADPPSSDYLYFIADKKGIVRFAKTLDQHNANIEKYGLQ